MAKRRILAGGLTLFLLLRLLPGFAGFWQKWISLPLLGMLRKAGDSLPFALLEWLGITACIFLLISLLRRKLLRSLTSLMLCLLTAYLALWYPLYFAPRSTCIVEAKQIAVLCGAIIDEFNAAAPDFSALPELPAKTARFPGWMRLFKVDGFCSFFTGEAIVSPELPASVLPFVAMHERMHLEGIAGEGAANIAAWNSCMELGGIYADSARLWALRCGMGILKGTDHDLYSACMQRMDADTWRIFRESGGSRNPAEASILHQAFYRLMDIETPAQDYEILAHCLAAGLPQ